MRPIFFPEANGVLTPPKGDDDCHPLPVHQTTGVFVSCWELTDEDIENLVKTRRLWLYVYGQAHPPVLPYTNYPFEKRPR